MFYKSWNLILISDIWILKMLPCSYKWSSEICLAQCTPQHTWEIMKLSEIKIFKKQTWKKVKNKHFTVNK